MVVEGQVMESMKWQPQPLPCEMSDVAHAIFDGADGLLLGAATSIGTSPVQVTICPPANLYLRGNCMVSSDNCFAHHAICHGAFKMIGGILTVRSCYTSL